MRARRPREGERGAPRDTDVRARERPRRDADHAARQVEGDDADRDDDDGDDEPSPDELEDRKREEVEADVAPEDRVAHAEGDGVEPAQQRIPLVTARDPEDFGIVNLVADVGRVRARGRRDDDRLHRVHLRAQLLDVRVVRIRSGGADHDEVPPARALAHPLVGGIHIETSSHQHQPGARARRLRSVRGIADDERLVSRLRRRGGLERQGGEALGRRDDAVCDECAESARTRAASLEHDGSSLSAGELSRKSRDSSTQIDRTTGDQTSRALGDDSLC